MNWFKRLFNKYPVVPNKITGFHPLTTTLGNKIRCPNCGSKYFYMGPEGGGSQNMQCSKCLMYWNYMGPFGFTPIGDRSEIFGVKPPVKENN